MLNISLNDFLKLKNVRFVHITDDKFKIRHLKGISLDSRTIEQQEIFWAIKGENFDGNNFIREAHSGGALFSVVAESHYDELSNLGIPMVVVPDTLKALNELAQIHRLKYNIPVIAITGSNGKTTVKEMIAHILQSSSNVHKTKGNQNNQIGCPLTMLNLNENHQTAVLELGTSFFGEIDTLSTTVQATHALITLIAEAHLDGFKNLNGVAKEKLRIFENLKYGSTIYQNLDDPFIAKYSRSNLNYVTYSLKRKKADYKGEYGPVDEKGCSRFTINGSLEIQLAVPGLHNVQNALAAAAVALDFGFSEEDVKKNLQSYGGYEKRMQVIKWNKVTIVNDAYNANPASMELAIKSVISMKRKGKLFLALGDMNEMGKQSKQMHIKLLEFAQKKDIDSIFILGDKMKLAYKELKESHQKKISVCFDLHDLSDKLAKTVNNDDMILLKGSRSMQMEKVMAYLP